MKGNNIIIFFILFPILSKPLHIIITNIMDQYYIFRNVKYYIDSINIDRVMGILFK